MNLWMLAQSAPPPLDSSWGSVLSFLGNLGQTGGVLFAVWLMLQHYREQGQVIKDNSDALRELTRVVSTICHYRHPGNK